MANLLEAARPLDQSVLWRLHDGYFRARGIAAWEEGEVPSYSTSNYATALQHTRLLRELLGREDDAEPIWLLELGAGAGRFAANFLQGLEFEDEGSGKPLLSRIRYVISDFSEKNLRDALSSKVLKPYVDRGLVLAARLDLRDASKVELLEGGELGAWRMVIANYVCCALPFKNIQCHGVEQWHEQWVSLSLKDGQETLEELLEDPIKLGLIDRLQVDFSWKPSSLRQIYREKLHHRVLSDLMEQFESFTCGYPHVFLEGLVALSKQMHPLGVVLVSDFGEVDEESLQGVRERQVEFYGNSLANPIHFEIFHAFARALNVPLLATGSPVDSIHTAMLRLNPKAGWKPHEEAAFSRRFEQTRLGEELIDFSEAARYYASQKDWMKALRFRRRCMLLEPFSPEHLYRAGDVAISAGLCALAVVYLEEGLKLAGEQSEWDFEFQLGRATCLMGETEEAIAWYEKASKRDLHPMTWLNLGVLYNQSGRFEDAYHAFREALRLDPQHKRARARMRELKEAMWQRLVEEFEGPGAKDPLGWEDKEEE